MNAIPSAARSNPRRDPAEVIRYWQQAGPRGWFGKDARFDREFRAHFLALHQMASTGDLDNWSATPDGALALLILLDQFPRNAFRGTPRMYATDPLARDYARRMLAAGFDARVDPALRIFCYLPFAHSENAADQDTCVRRHHAIGEPWLSHARGHRDIILRLGRSPHRNAILGRATTPAERTFLEAGGFAG